MPGEERLIVFTRYPEAGRTKTRMIPLLGAKGAAELQRAMTDHLLRRLDEWVRGDGRDLEIRYAGGTQDRMRAWLGSGYRLRPQGAGDLGARMERSLREAFGDGCARAAVIGTDVPGISTPLIREALTALFAVDLVLGPAVDGGYYLVGVHRGVPAAQRAALFHGIPWGGSQVWAATLAAAEGLGLSYRRLTELEDVDRPENWPVWERVRR